eukprot:NODE_5_length_72347_cov_1.339331.p53 type:complete len:122 gc:universal NODE_5_length_72347_cov_1.339331:5750-6115(+)
MFVLIIVSISSALTSLRCSTPITRPALFTTMSASTSRKTSVIDALFCMSQEKHLTSIAGCCLLISSLIDSSLLILLLSKINSFGLCLANLKAQLFPMPALAPVIKTVLLRIIGVITLNKQN